jgi:ABC-type transport system involved in cytochrome c biogenesis permease subunit
MIAFALRAGFWLILLGVGGGVIWRAIRRPGPAGYLPAGVVGMGILILAFFGMAPGEPEDRFNFEDLGTIPVQAGGRVKPFDTFARSTLMQISNKQSFTDGEGKPQPAVKWVLDVMFDTSKAFQYKVFYVSNDEVLALLGLEPRSGFRYSLKELIGTTPDQQRLLIEAAVAADKQRKDNKENMTLFQTKVLELMEHIDVFQSLAKKQSPRLIHPAQGSEDWDELTVWFSEDELPVTDLRPYAQDQRFSSRQDVLLLAAMMTAYEQNQVPQFNLALTKYRETVNGGVLSESVEKKLELESFFNHLEPFYVCTLLYVLVFVLVCVSWVAWTEPLRGAAFWLAILTWCVHTWALFTRMILMDRPLVFVTNLYSSAIFIGWGAVGLCLLLEFLHRNSIGNVVASVLGAITLLVAHNIATGDTLEMMQAVLDTNFWLATHVTCVTLGYTATYVAGFIGAAYILLGFMTPRLSNREAVKSLSSMLYGVVCFAMFLSFVGTVLGGIWADQSWGRFWGWDPKENGALLIVIWNALILHARWAGMVQQRGMATLAVGGNIVTTWSWFGTNMLGVGLHAYGFIPAAVFWVIFVVVVHLAIITVGCMPLSMWRSFNETAKPAAFVPPVVDARKRGRGKKGSAVQPA